MQVGQITFESEMGASGDDRGVLVGGEDSPSLCGTSRLLSCTPADLQAVLETRQISARMETYTVNLNKSEAEAARDALGKALYDRLFAWLVGRINISTAPTEAGQVAATIGVLDIFGVFLLFQPAGQPAGWWQSPPSLAATHSQPVRAV